MQRTEPVVQPDLIFYSPHQDLHIHSQQAVIYYYADIIRNILSVSKRHTFLPFLFFNSVSTSEAARLFPTFESVLSDTFNEDMSIFLHALMEKHAHTDALKFGTIKRHYCPQCARYLHSYETEKKLEKKRIHVIRFAIAGQAEPLFLHLHSLHDLIDMTVIGVKQHDALSGKSAIVPISGKQIPLIAAEGVSHPTAFTKFNPFNGRHEVSNEELRRYRNQDEHFISDLRINGSYEEEIEHDASTQFCKLCNHVVVPHLVECFYIDASGLLLKSRVKKHDEYWCFISSVHTPECQIQQTFEPSDGFQLPRQIFPVPSKDKVSQWWFDSYCCMMSIPFIISNSVGLLLCSREEYGFLTDTLSMLECLSGKNLPINRQLIITQRGREKTVLTDKGRFSRLLNVFKAILDSHQLTIYQEKIKIISEFLRHWKHLFHGLDNKEIDALETRVDFFIEKSIMSSLQYCIQKQQKNIADVNLLGYVDTLCELLTYAATYVYPYLHRTSFTEDPHVYKIARYFYRQVCGMIAAIADTSDDLDKDRPVFRADYQFDDDLQSQKFIITFADTYMYAKRILGFAHDFVTGVVLKTKDTSIRDLLTSNTDYLFALLAIDEIRFTIDTDAAKKSLKLQCEENEFYVPVYDVWSIKKRNEKLQEELKQIEIKILEKRNLLLDYDFLLKANRAILVKEEKNVAELFAQKQHLEKNIALLAELYTEEDKPYAETGV